MLKVPIPSAKSVLADVFVKTGSRQETPSINGISHFLEHLFFKGSKKYPTAQALSHALDAIGASYNANTGKEHTQFYIKAAKKHLRFIFETLSDMLQHPVFAEDEIEREKGVIIEEINMYEDTPMRHVEDVLEEVMWPAHPLGRNIAGTREVIRKITKKNIVDYVQTFYQPKNMIVSIAGAYSDKSLDDLIRKYWSGIVSKKVPAWQKVRETQTQPAHKLETKQTEQYHLAIGFRAYDFNHPSYVPSLVLATILGGGMSSRLFTEVRERRGLAYYVRAQSGNYQDTGNFLIQAGIRKESLLEALQLILKELQKIKNHKVEERELAKAKEYIKGTLTLSLEDSEALLGWYLEQIAFRKKILEPEQVFASIDRVTAADVQAVASDLFRNEKMNVAVIGAEKENAQLKKLLRVKSLL